MGGVAARGGKTAPTPWGARIVMGLWVAHAREDVAGSGATSDYRLTLHASDFMLPTSSTPHAWGLKDVIGVL